MCPTQFLASFFGDALFTSIWCHSGPARRCSPGITRQVSGSLKTLDLPNGCQDRHASDDPKARQLHEVGHALCPGFLVAHLRHFFSNPANLLLDVGAVLHLQFQLELLDLGQSLVLLPEGVLLIEPLAPFMLQMMAMRHTVHPVQGPGVGFHQLPALGQQLTHLTNMQQAVPTHPEPDWLPAVAPG